MPRGFYDTTLGHTPRGVIRHYTRTYAEGIMRHYTRTYAEGVIPHYTRTYGMPRGLHSKSPYVYNNTKTTTNLYEGLDDFLKFINTHCCKTLVNN
jgi:glycogen debranching enzyme